MCEWGCDGTGAGTGMMPGLRSASEPAGCMCLAPELYMMLPAAALEVWMFMSL